MRRGNGEHAVDELLEVRDVERRGIASESSAARGTAPIAARSLRLTASARCPIASGGTKRRSKWTPSTCASVVTTSKAPALRLDDRRVVAGADDDP